MKKLLATILLSMTISVQAQGFDMVEMREQIDIIDEQIVKLLAERTMWVVMIKNAKGTAPKKDIVREQQVLENVTYHAINYGANVEVTQKTFQCMMDGFVDMQKK
jgi:chorismate mutase